MAYYPINQFVADIQLILSKVPEYLDTKSDYVDLSKLHHISTNDLANFNLQPPNSPLNEVFLLIIQEAKEEQLDYLTLGCNELLKGYLLQINRDNQELFTEAYFTQLQRICIWTLDHPFIYLSHFWRYLIDCLSTACHYILDQEFFQGALILIDHLGLLGQGAVKHGLSTQRLQRLLRTLEVKAEEMGWIQGARQCRQQRHDIEVI